MGNYLRVACFQVRGFWIRTRILSVLECARRMNVKEYAKGSVMFSDSLHGKSMLWWCAVNRVGFVMRPKCLFEQLASVWRVFSLRRRNTTAAMRLARRNTTADLRRWRQAATDSFPAQSITSLPSLLTDLWLRRLLLSISLHLHLPILRALASVCI